ncbi:MAG: NAD(P)H-dependent glycerol-3-phosphate dehydrogenase [Schwartzia sp.]|nr:NAD(P)H-dependent glycerol-3-phosphate dehydrogenase [Schwartzia sp. (in: firmicutes)]
MRISILGCGRWGSFHAWYAQRIGHDVTLWGRPGSKRLEELRQTRRNEYLALPETVTLTDDLTAAVAGAETVIISIPSQSLRSLGQQLARLDIAGKVFVLCMKGLEIGTGERLSRVLRQETGPGPGIAVWVGPGHVQDFVAGIPNCMVMAAEEESLAEKTAANFSGPLIRFYYGRDLLGAEIGAAAKNVIGLAAGMLDGLRCVSLKGALMARGTAELSRLVGAMGGDPATIYGLSHLGDYEATLFSPHSNNRRYGENLVLGQPSPKLAEGVYTAEALMTLSARYGVELPICRTVYEIVRQGKDPAHALKRLFLRPAKSE